MKGGGGATQQIELLPSVPESQAAELDEVSEAIWAEKRRDFISANFFGYV
jgi:hypothetical protein